VWCVCRKGRLRRPWLSSSHLNPLPFPHPSSLSSQSKYPQSVSPPKPQNADRCGIYPVPATPISYPVRVYLYALVLSALTSYTTPINPHLLSGYWQYMYLSSYVLQVSRSLQSAIRLANPGMPFRRRSELEARRNPRWRYRDMQVSGTRLVPRSPSRLQSA
jgi:hypothetical protein